MAGTIAGALMRRPLEDATEEGSALLAEAAARGITLRALGGVAVQLRCPSARRPPLERELKDIDLVGHAAERERIGGLLADAGYIADAEFNLYQGATRLLFRDAATQRQLDVFLDELAMCHKLPLRDRLTTEADEATLAPTDLLLSKLQVVELNERDLKDAAALLADHEPDAARVTELLAADWGWWRTATENLERVARFAADAGLDRVAPVVARLRAAIDAAPKSLKWKARARVGERARWYQVPEEHE